MVPSQEPYPAEWTVRQARDAYLAENGFRLKDYDAPWVWVAFRFVTVPVPNPASRKRAVRFHDLHHVVTGYGTDPAGEAEISAWEVRGGTRGLSAFVRFLVYSGYCMGLLHSRPRTRRAYREATGRPGLFAVPMEQYESILDLTVGELRERLGVPRQGLATERGLHAGAPQTL